MLQQITTGIIYIDMEKFMQRLSILAAFIALGVGFISPASGQPTQQSAKAKDVTPGAYHTPTKAIPIEFNKKIARERKKQLAREKAEYKTQKRKIIARVNKLPPAQRRQVLRKLWKKYFQRNRKTTTISETNSFNTPSFLSADSCIDSNEPNDSFNDATSVADSQYIDACLDPDTESDWYTFDANAGEVIVVSVLAAAIDSGTCVDPFITLYDSTGITILDTDDDSGVDFDSQLNFIIPADGAYFLEVTGSPFGSCAGAYQLCLQTTFCEISDFGNDSTTAYPIAYNDSINGCIHTENDTDWFTFVATGKDMIEVNALAETLTPPSSLDPTLTLYDSDSTTVLEFSDDNGLTVDSRMATVLPDSGTYFLKVKGLSSTSTGHYTLTLSLLGSETGQVLYDQIKTLTPTGNGFPSQEFEASRLGFNSQGADDFEIPYTDGGWRITSIIADGMQTTGPPPEISNIDVSFYEDAGGLPGTLINTQTDILPALAEPDGDLFIILSSPVDLAGGKTYWLSIVIDEDFSTHGQWLWQNTAEINGNEHAWQNPTDGFGTGCTTWDTGSNCGAGGASQGNPRDAMFILCGERLNWSDYALVGNKIINFDGFSTVKGTVHSNRDISFAAGLTGSVTGNVTAVRDVDILENNTITGDVKAGGTTTIDTGATVTGLVASGALIANRPFPPLEFGPFSGPDLKVVPNGEETALPGTYDVVRCSSDAILHMTSGVYNMNRLVLEADSKLKLDLTNGAIVINVDERLLFRKATETIIESASGTSEDIFINFDGIGKVLYAKDARHQGNVFAPTARVKLATDVGFLGSICAKRIDIYKGTRVHHHSISDSIPKTITVNTTLTDERAITDYELSENYPNPFNPTTTIRFSLPHTTQVHLTIYDVQGKLVRKINAGQLSAGRHKITFDGNGLASGVYFYRMEAGTFRATRKMVLAQ